MDNEKKIRITLSTIVFMGVVAFFYDSLQALTTVGIIGFILSTLISIFAWLHFYLWFKIKGVSFLEGRLSKILARRLAPFILAMLAELPPGFNAVAPAITIGVVVTAYFVYVEDTAVKRGVISEEDLKEFRKYLSKNKRILAGNIDREDLELLYQYGEKRISKRLQESPKAMRIASIANTVSRDMNQISQN